MFRELQLVDAERMHETSLSLGLPPLVLPGAREEEERPALHPLDLVGI